MTDRACMLLTIEEAGKSKDPLKCAAVIVKEGKVIAKTCNSRIADKDATAHAEIKAIREAGKKLGHKLRGCTVYAICEPCTMCLSAFTFAQIKKLFYGVTLKNYGKEIDIDATDFLSKALYKFEIVANFMEEECRNFYKYLDK